jgi:hypothetical protein
MIKPLFFLFAALSSLFAAAGEIYINAATGNDRNSGARKQPLKTIAEAAKRLNTDSRKEAATLILSAGVYPLTETVFFNNNKFTVDNRLTIRSEVLPGEIDWTPQQMPIITSVIAGTNTAGDGEESRGFEIEVNHVTIEGLRFTGSPLYYYMDNKQNRRYYPVWRDGRNLDDLLITQCLFAGNMDIMPIRVAVIANGTGLVVDHCVFFNCQNSVVFEGDGGPSLRNAMRYCLVYESRYSGVWTTGNTSDDFEFHHNIVANSRTAWIKDNNSTHNYKIHDCIYSNNLKFTGNGSDDPVGSQFLDMTNVQTTGEIIIERDPAKNNYLQLKEGSFGSELKAGLFK